MICRKYKYDVSLSFAEEDDGFVKDVVRHLKHRKSRYYYYKDELILSWGKDLAEYLSSIYSHQSRLCVIFISAAYREKVWTTFEFREAQIKAKKEIHEYILPFKIDDTELPEIPSTIKRLSSRDFDAERLADAICRKINDHKKRDPFYLRLCGMIRYYLRSPRHLVFLTIVALLTGWPLFRDHLTPVDTLAPRLYGRHMTRFRSVCGDGTLSRSRGRGTCSHHLGVTRNVDTLIPMKTMDECRVLAKEISWLDE